MHIPAHILQQAMELYLQAAYPGGVPGTVLPRVEAVRRLAGESDVPLAGESPLERDPANAVASYALRLGQPMYPYMKLVLDPAPAHPLDLKAPPTEEDFILRVDSHDRHLHAAPGSPDAAWLAAVRTSNKELGERIEHAWSAAGLPTFKDFLKRRLEARKARSGAGESH